MSEWQQHVDSVLKEILIDEETLQKRIAELGAEITADYTKENVDDLLVIGILKGSVVFMSDLLRHLEMPVSIDFMITKSYDGSVTTGEINVIKDISESITGKHVLIVEDIIDTGLTLKCLRNLLKERKPASLKICTLLSKPDRRKVELEADYTGFVIPDEFIVGMGLDIDGHYRQLPYIGTLKPEVYE